MRKIYTLFLLAAILIIGNSFKAEGYRDLFKDEGTLNASINGKTFVTRPSAFYRASLVTKPLAFASSASAARNRVVTSMIFYGLDSTDADGRFFQESIGIEYTFSTEKGELTDANDVSFDLHYNLADYYMLPEGNFFKVSKLEWSADKTYFILSAKFDGTMHRRGYSNDLQPVVRIKGNIFDIKVSVPPWIVSRLATQQASLGQ